MQIDQLFSELETLPYRERLRRMVEFGRQSLQDHSIRQMLNTLAEGEMYPRILALQSTYGSRDGNAVLRALTDPSRTVRQMATRMIASLCDDEQVQAAFKHLHEKAQILLLRMLQKQRRQNAVDGYLEQRLVGEPDTWLHLIGFASDGVIATLIEPILLRIDYTAARRLAARHPVLTANALRELAERSQQMDKRLLWVSNAMLPTLSDRAPDPTLAAVKALTRHLPIAQLDLQSLVQRRPVETSELLLTLGERARVDFAPTVAKLPIERIIALFEAGYLNGQGFFRWGAKLDAALRGDLFRRFGSGWGDANGAIPLDALELLPRDLRENEARRHLNIPAFVTEPKQRLPYAALLPWQEALDELTPYLRNADAELRALAWFPLIRAVKFHRDRLPELLTMLMARRNEQDPVRVTFLHGLVQLPPGIWQTEHLPSLEQIFRDALNASDLSPSSAAALETLTLKLLSAHPAWGAAWIATLVKERGHIHLYELRRMLSPEEVQLIASTLLPVLQSWATREREQQIYNFAAAFGRQLKHFPSLLDLLETVLITTANDWLVRNLLNLIERHDPARFHRLVTDLLQQDASWITVSSVHHYLHEKAQHLLTPYLGQTAFAGRFSTGNTRYILPLNRGFYRWTSRQQAIFAGVLSHVTADNERDMPTLLLVIGQLSGLMMIAPTRLFELALSEKIAVRDTAVRALGRLDAGEGVPVLLEAMGDDRGRIAIYALRQSLLEMTADRALALLRVVPMDRVTVAKEVVRLIGDLRTADAYEELLAFAAGDLHNDVRVALVRALWNYLEDERTWAIFFALAEMADSSILAIIARIPVDTLSPHAQGQLVNLLAKLLVHADPVVRLNVLRRFRDLPVTDPDQHLLEPLFSAVQSMLPQEAEAAANAIFATYAGRQTELIRQTLIRLLPNRRTLLIVLNALNAAVRTRLLYLVETASVAVDVLESDPLMTAYQIRAALNGLAWNRAAELLVHVSQSRRLHAGVLAEALSQISWTIWKADEMEHFEAFMRSQTDPLLRRIGLAALQSYTGAGRRGWTEAARQQLEHYRDDPDALVASVAHFTFPPDVSP